MKLGKKNKKCLTNKMQYKTKKQLFYPSAVSTDSSKMSRIYHNLHYLFKAIQFSCHFTLSRPKSQATLPAYLVTEEGMLYHISFDVAYIR